MDYTFEAVDWSAKGHKAPDFLLLHPWGQLPAFRDGELVLVRKAVRDGLLTAELSCFPAVRERCYPSAFGGDLWRRLPAGM